MSQNRWNELPQPDRNNTFQNNQGGPPVLPPPAALAQPQGLGQDREQYHLPSIQNQNGNMRYPLPSIRDSTNMSYMGDQLPHQSPQLHKQGPIPRMEDTKPGSSQNTPQQLHAQVQTPPVGQQQLQSNQNNQQNTQAPQQNQSQQSPPISQHQQPQHQHQQQMPPSQQPGSAQMPHQQVHIPNNNNNQQPQQGQNQGQTQTQQQPGGPGFEQQFPAYQYGQNSVLPQQPMFPPNDYRPLNVRDALSYLEKVKVQFAKQPDVYNHFLDIMKDFKSQAIDTPGVIDRVSSLFRGHTNLIQGFNTFLPAGYRIECSLDPLDPNPIRVTTPMGSNTLEDLERWRYEQQNNQGGPQQQQQPQQQPQQPPQAQQPQPPQPSLQQPPNDHGSGDMNQLHAAAVERRQQGNVGPAEFNYVFGYVNQIKKRYQSQPEIYNSFLEILQAYKREQLRIYEVYTQVKQLFRDAPDLLEDFKHFLPNRSVPSPEMGYEQVRLPPVGNFKPPLNSIESPTGAQGGDVSNVRRDSIVSSAQQLPAPSHHISMAEEINFFDKVKKLLPKQTYLEFLKLINLFTQRIIDLNTLVERVDGFIGQQPELIEWFKQFVGYEGTPLAIENIAARKHVVDLSQCRSCGPSYRLIPKTETVMPCSGRDEMCWEVLNDEWVGHPTWASEDSGFVAHRKNQYEEILYRIEEERHEYDHYIGSNQRTIQVLETIANRIANMTLEEQAEFKLPPGLGQKSRIYQKVINKIYDKKNGAEVIEALHSNPAVAVPIILKRLKQKDEEWKRAQREWNKVWRETEQKVFFKSLDHIGLTFKQADRKQLTARALISEIVAVKAEATARRKIAAAPTPKSQISTKVDDVDVLLDLWRLVIVFLENGGNYSQHDREAMNNFLKSFLPLFFGLDASIIEKVYPSNKRSNDVSLGGLLKKSKADAKEAMDQDENVDVEPFDADAILSAGEAPWLKFQRATPPAEDSGQTERILFNLFGNTTIYLFLRLVQIIYDRLNEVKSYESVVKGELENIRSTKYANDLNLYDSKLEKAGLLFEPDNAYEQALSLCKRQIEGELEPQLFEEALRQAYRNRAYKLYTIDKSLNALVKQLHAIITDQTTGSVLLCYEHDRNMPDTDVKHQILYRMQIRQLLGPEEAMFRIDWSEETKEMGFQHLGSSDLSLKGVAEAQKKWDYYVTSYMMSVPTEGIPLERIKPPLLSRALHEVTDEPSFAILSQNLSARICMNTYKLFFEPDTCDYIVRVVKDKDVSIARAAAERKKRFDEIIAEETEPSEDNEFTRWFKQLEEAPVDNAVLAPDVTVQKEQVPVSEAKQEVQQEQPKPQQEQEQESYEDATAEVPSDAQIQESSVRDEPMPDSKETPELETTQGHVEEKESSLAASEPEPPAPSALPEQNADVSMDEVKEEPVKSETQAETAAAPEAPEVKISPPSGEATENQPASEAQEQEDKMEVDE